MSHKYLSRLEPLIFIIVFISISLVSSTGMLAQQQETETPKKAVGLSVNPGGMYVQNVPPGLVYDFFEESGIPLTIKNRDDNPHIYLLSTHKPSEIGTERKLGGYLEIPDPGWYWFEKDEVRVEANSEAEVKMYLKVPDEEKYYNQHWSVYLRVGAKPEAGSTIALTLYPRIEIETLSKEDVKERPDGFIGLVPSTLLFENLPLGKNEKMKVRVYNNDTKRHRYKIKSMIFPDVPAKGRIFPSPTYSWLPNPKWIKPKKVVKIGPGESADISFNVKVPKNEKYYGKKWEAIIFVEPKKGVPGFARVQIQTEKAEENEE